MNNIYKVSPLVLVLLAAGFAGSNAQAQTRFLRLKGIGFGSAASAGGTATDLDLVGDYAYLAWSNSADTNHPGGFEIFCVTNPAAPTWLGGYESSTPANAIQVAGHYAYLAVATTRTLTNDPGSLEIVDVSDAANPVRVGQADTFASANRIRVAGAVAYLPESTRWTGSNLVGALELFDVTMPTNPAPIGIYHTGASAMSVGGSGSFAYLADGVTDLRVLDVSDPTNPASIAVYDVDERSTCAAEFDGTASFIQVVSNLVFSAGKNGLYIMDVSMPANPVRIGGHCPIVDIYAFHASGQYVYETMWSSYANSFLLAVSDCSNPTNLVPVSYSLIPGWPRALQAAGNYVYLGTNPLIVYEISEQPLMSISTRAEVLVLTWERSPDFVLQHTTSLENPTWTDVPGSQNQTSLELPMTNRSEFFRLARQ